MNSCSQNILIGAGDVRDHRPSVVPLGPELLAGAGLGPLFVLIFLVGLIKVDNNDTGVASGPVNVGQQVGGAIGLAIVGTVAWGAVASTRDPRPPRRRRLARICPPPRRPWCSRTSTNRPRTTRCSIASDSQPRRLKISDRATALRVSASPTPITNRHGCRLPGAMVESIQRLL